MDQEQAAAFVDAIEQAFAEMGVDLYPQAGRFKAFIDARYPHLEAAQSREKLLQFVESMSSMESEVLAQMVAMTLALPSITAAFVEDAVRLTSEELPKAKSGRRFKASTDEMRAVVAHIGALHTKGVALREAQNRAVQKFGISLRSIQRIWRQRETLAESPFQTMNDIIHFLKK